MTIRSPLQAPPLPPSGAVFRFGDFQLDVDRRTLTGPAGAAPLQPKVYDLLLLLVRSGDVVVTKSQLLDAIWPGVVVTESVLTRAVHALRIALDDDASDPQYIRALRGVGYRFVAPVTCDGAAAPRAAAPSLAILPFHALTEPRDEALELGLADTLISHLSRRPDLLVRSLASVRACLAAAGEPAEAARLLGVDFYLEATAQMREQRLRVNARLVMVDDGAVVWSESFDHAFSDVFELQDALCAQIASRLAAHVNEEDVAEARGASVAPEAYRAFLEGRLFAGRHTRSDLLEAVEQFERALDLAPGYAEAWAALGECHELLGTEGGDQAAAHYTAARRAATRALALTPALPDAACLIAKIAWQYDWDWRAAESAFLSAIERYPNIAELHIHYSDYLCLLGRPEEGVEQAERAVAIDPVSPWFNTLLAQGLHMSRRYDDAVQQADRTRRLAPDFPFVHLFAGLAQFCAGRREQGIARLREGVATGRADFTAALGLCLGLAGRTDEARAVLASLRSEPGVGPFSLGLALLGCGEPEQAARQFETCIERRDWHILLLGADPIFDSYRKHESYGALAQRIGLPGGAARIAPALDGAVQVPPAT